MAEVVSPASELDVAIVLDGFVVVPVIGNNGGANSSGAHSDQVDRSTQATYHRACQQGVIDESPMPPGMAGLLERESHEHKYKFGDCGRRAAGRTA